MRQLTPLRERLSREIPWLVGVLGGLGEEEMEVEGWGLRTREALEGAAGAGRDAEVFDD